MNVAIHVDNAYCQDCGEDEIYMDLKVEPSLHKVGAMCDSCDRDYGVIDRVPLTDISHQDEAWDQAKEYVRDYFD